MDPPKKFRTIKGRSHLLAPEPRSFNLLMHFPRKLGFFGVRSTHRWSEFIPFPRYDLSLSPQINESSHIFFIYFFYSKTLHKDDCLAINDISSSKSRCMYVRKYYMQCETSESSLPIDNATTWELSRSEFFWAFDPV